MCRETRIGRHRTCSGSGTRTQLAKNTITHKCVSSDWHYCRGAHRIRNQHSAVCPLHRTTYRRHRHTENSWVHSAVVPWCVWRRAVTVWGAKPTHNTCAAPIKFTNIFSASNGGDNAKRSFCDEIVSIEYFAHICRSFESIWIELMVRQ